MSCSCARIFFSAASTWAASSRNASGSVGSFFSSKAKLRRSDARMFWKTERCAMVLNCSGANARSSGLIASARCSSPVRCPSSLAFSG
jgi:hypothetical protein